MRRTFRNAGKVGSVVDICYVQQSRDQPLSPDCRKNWKLVVVDAPSGVFMSEVLLDARNLFALPHILARSFALKPSVLSSDVKHRGHVEILRHSLGRVG